MELTSYNLVCNQEDQQPLIEDNKILLWNSSAENTLMGEPHRIADKTISITQDEGFSMVKRKRQPNFTLKEKMELFTIISEKYKEILEDKATDKSSVYEKDKCWDKVESNFNAVTTTGIFRDKDCLKRCYENRKREIRKLKAKEKQEIMKTGGGTPDKIVLDAADEVLLQIMNPKTVLGLENPYDSDMDQLVRKNQGKDDEKKLRFNQKNIEENFPTFKKASDLKKPKHPALTPYYLSDNLMQEAIQDNIPQEIGDNAYRVDSLNEFLEVYNGEESRKSFGIAGTSSREEAPDNLTPPTQMCTDTSNSSDQNMVKEEPREKQRNNSLSGVLQMAGRGRKSMKGVGRGKVLGTQHVPNRRPGIQILSSSHIAKKYDELLDKRKVLLDKQIELVNEDLTFQRAKNRLELELLNLKVAKEKRNIN